MMEKYGVHQEDPVEVKAKGMVKEGSAGSYGDARAKIVKKESENKKGEGEKKQ